MIPNEPVLRKKWLTAIQHTDKGARKANNIWEPKSKSAVVCFDHFTQDDYIKVTIHGKSTV